MKLVKAYSNTFDNTFCLQASILSVLNYYFSGKVFSEEEVGVNTDYHPKYFSWFPKSVVWLDKLGLDVKLYSPADYKRIGIEGLEYLKELKGKMYEVEEKRGEYKYLPEVQIAIKEMISSNLWIDKMLSVEELRNELKDQDTLAIGKTIYEWLDGNYIAGKSHFITIVKEYSSEVWLIQDPGLPKKQDRKVNQYINGHSILGDIILIKNHK